jgi:hypothetical protein
VTLHGKRVPDTGGIDGLFLPKPTRSQGSSRRLALSSLRQLLPAQCSILVYSISKGFFLWEKLITLLSMVTTVVELVFLELLGALLLDGGGGGA